MESGGAAQPVIFRVTVQVASEPSGHWRVIATGTWIPGQDPQLDNALPSDLIHALFDSPPPAINQSARSEVDFDDTLYAVVFRKLSDRASRAIPRQNDAAP